MKNFLNYLKKLLFENKKTNEIFTIFFLVLLVTILMESTSFIVNLAVIVSTIFLYMNILYKINDN
jgi:hypothetical protein